MAVILAEWSLGSKLLAELFVGADANPSVRDAWVAGQAPSATAQDAHAIMVADISMDITDLLPHVKVPTLVVHSRDDKVVPIELGREVAAGIPAARFVSIEGPHSLLGPGRTVVAGHVFPFLLGESSAISTPESGVRPATEMPFRAVLFTDAKRSYSQSR